VEILTAIYNDTVYRASAEVYLDGLAAETVVVGIASNIVLVVHVMRQSNNKLTIVTVDATSSKASVVISHVALEVSRRRNCWTRGGSGTCRL
jgi:hypothetical protein